jgi:hypothetical protein
LSKVRRSTTGESEFALRVVDTYVQAKFLTPSLHRILRLCADGKILAVMLEMRSFQTTLRDFEQALKRDESENSHTDQTPNRHSYERRVNWLKIDEATATTHGVLA